MNKARRRRQRIYIFPNLFGFVAFAFFLLMLVVGATFDNNLVFMMAFLSISVGLIAILQTARNLRDIELLNVHVTSQFAGLSTQCGLSLTNRSGDPKINIDVYAEYRGGIDGKTSIRIPSFVTSLERQSTHSSNATLVSPKTRGRYKLRRVCISSKAPYGLFRAWIYLEGTSEFIVYPAAIGLRELPSAPLSDGEDFSGHKLYSPGDPMSRIDWKVYTRRHKHYVKEFKDGTHPKFDFKLNPKEAQPIERQLSQLSLWINEAYQRRFEFRLETNTFSGGYGQDRSHHHRCLSELALWTG